MTFDNDAKLPKESSFDLLLELLEILEAMENSSCLSMPALAKASVCLADSCILKVWWRGGRKRESVHD